MPRAWHIGCDVLQVAAGVWRHGSEPSEEVETSEVENVRLKLLVADLALDNRVLNDRSGGKLLSAERKRRCVAAACQRHALSERRACAAIGFWRSVQQYRKCRETDEEVRLRKEIIELAHCHRRYASRRITNMLRVADWRVNHKRVERVWREKGLQVPNQVGGGSGRGCICLGGRVCACGALRRNHI